MLEIEAKHRVASHDPIRQTLKRLGAEFLGRGLENNRIYDFPDRRLYAEGKGVRVRSIRAESGAPPKPTLTVKGPALAGAFKARQEIELRVEDDEAAERFVEMLGLAPVMKYVKRRESWSYRGCRVELDTVPGLGAFVEIEGPDESAIHAVRHALRLDREPHVPKSYIGLLDAYCREHRLDPLHIGASFLSNPMGSD